MNFERGGFMDLFKNKVWIVLFPVALTLLPMGCGKNINGSSPASPAGLSFPVFTLNNFIGAGAPTSMNGPLELAISGVEVWETDYNTNSLQAWSAQGLFSMSVTGYGAPVTHLSAPWGLAVGPDGYLYVADQGHYQVVEFSPTGQYVTVFGNPQLGADYPIGVAVGTNYAYILDGPRGIFYSYTLTGNGSSKTFTAPATLGNSGPVTLGNFPYGICLDPSGNVYIADDTKSRVAKFSPTGTFEMAVSAGLNGTRSVAVDFQGNIFAQDENTGLIHAFTPEGTPVTVFGDPSGTEGIAVDSQGNVYETLYNNNLVAVYRRN
jgi:tripartite motif-containing protein 71